MTERSNSKPDNASSSGTAASNHVLEKPVYDPKAASSI